jgi:hypothetical protein
MNPYAGRGAAALRDSPWTRRPRALAAAMLVTFALFAYTVHVTHREDEEAVWIWMGMRSDGRCGREFGTDHITETKCGKGSPCCSSHGWCGASEEYCSPTLGCQSGCWDKDHPRELELNKGKSDTDYEHHDDDYAGDEWDAMHNDSGYDEGWDDDYEDYDGHYPSRGYRGRYGGHRYNDDYDDDYDDDDYGQYVDHDRYPDDDDPGIYDPGDSGEAADRGAYGDAGQRDAFAADDGEPLDPEGRLDSRHPDHAWAADELLFADERQGGGGADAGDAGDAPEGEGAEVASS